MISPKLSSLPVTSRQQDQPSSPSSGNSPPPAPESPPQPGLQLCPGTAALIQNQIQSTKLSSTQNQLSKMTNFSIAAIMNSGGSGSGPRSPFGSPGGLTGPGSLAAAQKLHQQHLTNLREQALLMGTAAAARRGLEDTSSAFGRQIPIL